MTRTILDRFPRVLTLLFGAALILSLPACDSGDDGDGGGGGGGNVDSGEFNATFGGDLDGSFNGNAFFAVVEDEEIPDERAFVLVLVDGGVSDIGSGEFITFVRFGDRPGTGMYPVNADPDVAGGVVAAYYDFQNSSSGFFVTGETGSLTLSTSSSNRVAGTFSFSGTGFDISNPQNPQEVNGTVSGSFDATLIDLDSLPSSGGF